MPTFSYRAKQGPVATVEGELRAESRAEALSRLEAMGYTPLSVTEKQVESSSRRVFSGWRVGARNVTIFTRQLASLTRSGVPILRALSTIREQTENARLAAILAHVEGSVRDGNTLSESLSGYPAEFSELYVNMVRSGEGGGILDDVLFRMADAREKEEDTRRRIQAATAYPMLVVVVGILTVFILLSFFMPRVVELFRDYKTLPLPTRILIGLSDVFAAHWHWIILIGVLFGAVLKRLAGMEKGRTFVDGIRLRLPLLGRFLRESDIARFARTFSLLLDSGVPIERALTLGANTMHNAVLRDEMLNIREETVRQGLPVSEGLKRSRHFPVFMANMVGVGEEGGKLEGSLLEVANFYEKEVEQRTRLATSLLEPLLILVVGLAVGFIVFAMLLPIFQLGSGL
ncbi:MAG: type II secretion system F family protein [Lentisphaerae bacterium]|nr:type II secretion system F family protein [Lentisphaerota bacterium]